MSVPVLFIIYNRPELTRRALAALAAARPDRLLVAADGPRSPSEAQLCEQARSAVEAQALDCPIERDYASHNLGCGVRVHTAVDWALSRHEAVIVVEDDCLVSPSFLQFCRELLLRYRDDERVMHVSGHNFQPEQPTGRYSYFFSKYPHVAAWATWRRAWRHYDFSMRRWPRLRDAGLLGRWCDDRIERRFWRDVFDRTCGGAPDVWDYQWTFACWAGGGLSVTPQVNLVRNVGAGPEATHTKVPGPWFDQPTGTLARLHHPARVERDATADRRTFDHLLGGSALRRADALPARIARALDAYPLAYRAARGLWRLARRRGEPS